MRPVRDLLVAVCVVALPMAASAWGECRFEGPREASVDASGAKTLRVIAKAGSLTIAGEDGAARVEATGKACAGSESQLEKIQLRAERSGDEVRIEVVTPKGWGSWGDSGSLDLEVRTPKALDVVVEDGSGNTDISDVASLRIEDGSGNLEVRGVTGRVVVDDGSGDLVIRDVGGDLRIDDGSGEIDVEKVGGSVDVDDGSGSMRIEDVTGSVTVDDDGSGEITIEGVRHDVLVKDDGSGGIDVRDVDGDFTVEQGGSGGVHYSGVKGKVSVPSR